MDILGDIGTLFFMVFLWVILPLTVPVVIGVAIGRHFQEKASDAASIARIQEAARTLQESDEKVWPPRPNRSAW